MQDKILKAVFESYIKIGSPKKIAVAVSGGADSIALLHVLHTLQKELSFTLSCVHINHGLRTESDDEEKFVLNFCQAQGIYCEAFKVEVPAKGSLEDAARRVRYESIEQFYIKHKVDIIALAHHSGDQAETVLMHLFYGSGLRGLSGIKEVNDKFWRPLLDVSKNEILDYALENNLKYCEDLSNLDTKYTRNAIRINVIPEIEKVYPSAVKSICKAAKIIRDENSFWDTYVDKWLEKNAIVENFLLILNRKSMEEAHIAFKRRILEKVFELFRLSLSFDKIEEIIEALANSERKLKINLPNDFHIHFLHDRIFVMSDTTIKNFTMGCLEESDFSGLGDGIFEQSFDKDKLSGAVLRTRQEGDKFILLNSTKTKSLKDYMIDKKIPEPLRSIWPVLAKDDNIIWVLGYGVSNYAAIGNNTQAIIRFEYRGILPDGRRNKLEEQ